MPSYPREPEYGAYAQIEKYPPNPVVDRRVDRLEDRLAKAEAARVAVTAFEVIESMETSPYAKGQYQDQKEVVYMPPEEAVVPPTAESFLKCVGMIVNDVYHDQYVEVISVVENFVAIKRSPSFAPELIDPRYLALWP